VRERAPLRDAAREELLQLLVHNFAHLRRRVAGLRCHDDLKAAVETLAVVERTHILRDLHVVHEALVEAGILVAREHVG
jgi:hypothetical protein